MMAITPKPRERAVGEYSDQRTTRMTKSTKEINQFNASFTIKTLTNINLNHPYFPLKFPYLNDQFIIL